tara:strand:- start:71727 stop:72023 length:297 start_codon:yes stop_codon:yes gene_type:complete
MEEFLDNYEYGWLSLSIVWCLLMVVVTYFVAKIMYNRRKFSLHVVMWRLSCLIIVPLSLIIVLFRLIQFGGMNYKYYFLDPDKSLIGKWFYKWLANAT